MQTVKLYSVDMVKKTLVVEERVGGYLGKTTVKHHEFPCVWAEGQVGAIPVFATREAAEAYKGDSDYPIAELDINEPTVQ